MGDQGMSPGYQVKRGSNDGGVKAALADGVGVVHGGQDSTQR